MLKINFILVCLFCSLISVSTFAAPKYMVGHVTRITANPTGSYKCTADISENSNPEKIQLIAIENCSPEVMKLVNIAFLTKETLFLHFEDITDKEVRVPVVVSLDKIRKVN